MASMKIKLEMNPVAEFLLSPQRNGFSLRDERFGRGLESISIGANRPQP